MKIVSKYTNVFDIKVKATQTQNTAWTDLQRDEENGRKNGVKDRHGKYYVGFDTIYSYVYMYTVQECNLCRWYYRHIATTIQLHANYKFGLIEFWKLWTNNSYGILYESV